MLSVYICYPTCPVIAMAHHLCLRHLVWPDFPASDFKFICNPPTADKIGFELGLFGFVFLWPEGGSFS